MTRLLSTGSRAVLAGLLFLITLAILRWAPVYAEPAWNVRALPLALPAVIAASLAAVTGRQRAPRRLQPLALALALSVAALAAVVALRGPGGLPTDASDAHGNRVRLPPGPIDIVGDELDGLPRSRHWTLRWAGPLRVAETEARRLWVEGRGSVSVLIDGREWIRAEGDPFRAGVDVLLGRGRHGLKVRLDHDGPGPRLRLGWTRPNNEMIPSRALGPEAPPLLWKLTDALALMAALLVAALAWVAPWEVPRPLSAPGRVERREIAVSLVGYTALVALMSWPLVLDLAGSGVVNRPDGRLNAWIMAWDVHALLHDPLRLFQAPIFHPLPDALAFSENLLLPAILASPAILFGNPVLGYNLVLLGSAIVSGLGAQLLARRVSGDRFTAFVGGAVFAVGAHRWFRMAHLHAEVTLFLPFALLALDRFWEKRTLPRALLVGVFLALQGLSSVYLGAITATALAAAIGLGILGGLRLRHLLQLGCGLLLAALLMAPVAWPYLRMRAFQGMEFTLADEANFATTIESYGASSTSLWGPLTARHADDERVRDALFPGLVPLVLGIAGLARAPRRYRNVALTASALAIVISLGPATGFYRFLHEHVVFFRGIRALSRFSLIPVLALSVLMALAIAGRRRLAIGALVLALAESSQIPLGYARYLPPGPAARWLAGKEGAVVYLPVGPERDTAVMLQGIAHFRPLVNGDSGFIPRAYDRVMELLDAPLTEDALRFLRATGVTHVVTRDERALPLLERFGEEHVWGVPPGDAARSTQPGDQAAAVLWGVDGVWLDLGAPRQLGAIQFEVSNGPWIPRPRVDVSSDGTRWQAVDAAASLADAVLSLTRDPRHARGELRFAPLTARYLRLDPALPARPGLLWLVQ